MEAIFRLISIAKATHTIKKITKNGVDFTNPSNEGFRIDSKGNVFTDTSHKLPKGTYVITVSTKDKLDSKIKITIQN